MRGIFRGILLAGLVFAGAIAMRGEAFQAVTASLSGYWPMNSIASGTTPDASGNGNTATVVGAAAGPGFFNGALLFNGSSNYLTAASSASLDVAAGAFTLAAWVNLGAVSQGRVINKWNGTVGWLMDVNSTTGGTASAGMLRLKMNDGVHNIDYSAAGGLGTAAWHHVAAVVDRTAGNLKLYVDGAQIGVTTPITDLTGTLTNAALLGMGSIPSALGSYYNGAMDEVRVYKIALTQPQILTLFQPTAPATLSATAGNATVSLSWGASTGAQTYTLYRSVTSGTGYFQVRAGLTGTSYVDGTASNGVTYYYVVRGRNSIESANSPEASASPVAPPPRTQTVGQPHGRCGNGAIDVPGPMGLGAALLALAMILVRRRA
jgi:hypothetical protein